MITLRNRKLKHLALFCLLVALIGCEENTLKQPESATSAQQKTVTPANKAESVKGVGIPSEVEPPPPLKFVYVAAGRRDPFKPLVLVRRAVDVQGEQGLMTPLQQYDVQQYKLAAIIIGYREPMAMVNAPDGKSYILRKGTKVGKNGGKVIRISVDAVQVEEIYKDLTDKLLQNIVEIKLPKREGV